MSAAEIAAKSEDIMDVNQSTVERVMREFDVRRLLHGHTHRPGVHDFAIDGRPAQRIVLGAWYEQASFARGDERELLERSIVLEALTRPTHVVERSTRSELDPAD